MIELLAPSALLAAGRSSLAAAVRALAASLGWVADALDGGTGHERAGRSPEVSPPAPETRARIAEVLRRARTQYDDAVRVRSAAATGRRTGSRPRGGRR